METNHLNPSLLNDIFAKKSQTVSWDEVYDLISHNPRIKSLTDNFRLTADEKVKLQLPAVTTAVQLNGTGKSIDDIVGFTGVTHCDFDHVPAERLTEVLALAKADPHTLLCNVSLSGNGVHIYARVSLSPKINQNITENGDSAKIRLNFGEENYFDAFMTVNCYYADLLNLPFDEQCGNPNKTLSLSHDPEAHYNPNAEVFVITHTDSTDLTDCLNGVRLSTHSTLSPNNVAKDTEEQNSNPLNPLNPYASKTQDASNPSATKKHWVKEETDPKEFAEKYVRNKRGLTFTKGCRNKYLYECLNMMNLLGVPLTEAEAWMRSFDLPEREKQSVLRSAYHNTAKFGTFEKPFTWREEKTCLQSRDSSHTHSRANIFKQKSADIAGNDDEECEKKENEERNRRSPHLKYHSFPDYQWPKFIQQMIDCGETKAQRDVVLLSAVTVLGAMLGRLVKFKYSKRFWHPTLQTFIVAPPASGKSVVSLVRRLAEPLHDELLRKYEQAKKKYEQAKTAYDIAGKERVNMEMPEPPTLKMFLIAGNNSSTGILENLADADGNALICESEADTLSGAINADYGNWDDTLRRAHDHDRLSYNRRTNKEYRQIKYPCMGVLICGTPAQVKPLIPSAENGLFSRQLFATMPPIDEFIDQFGDDDVDLNARFLRWGKEWNCVLRLLKSEVSSIDLQLTAEQKETFNTHFTRLFKHADATRYDYHMKSSVAREAINVLRIMTVVAFFRAFDRLAFEHVPEDIVRIHDPLKASMLINDYSELVPADDIPAENIRDGVCPRYLLRISDDDMNAVLDLSEPLYRTACEVLTLLPWTEAERLQPTAMEQLFGLLPLTFTRKEALDIGKEMGISDSTIDSKLRRMRKNKQIRLVEHGIYEFV